MTYNAGDVSMWNEDESKVYNVVVLGDSRVGKSSLIFAFAIDTVPYKFIPSEFNDFPVEVELGGEPVTLNITNVTEIELLRYHCVPSTDVFIVLFSIDSRDSFQSAGKNWIPSIRKHFPTTPVILVGMKSDLRTTMTQEKYLSSLDKKIVPKQKAHRLARRFKRVKYIECSTTNAEEVRQVFRKAAKAVINPKSADETMISTQGSCGIM